VLYTWKTKVTFLKQTQNRDRKVQEVVVEVPLKLVEIQLALNQVEVFQIEVELMLVICVQL